MVKKLNAIQFYVAVVEMLGIGWNAAKALLILGRGSWNTWRGGWNTW